MSAEHPTIAVTGSSGAGTTTTSETFRKMFNMMRIKPAWVEGDRFHRFTRPEMDVEIRKAREAVMDSIVRSMDDYLNYITPQFSRTHINFQRVPTVDTSNPLSAKGTPSLDESFVVIRLYLASKKSISLTC